MNSRTKTFVVKDDKYQRAAAYIPVMGSNATPAHTVAMVNYAGLACTKALYNQIAH